MIDFDTETTSVQWYAGEPFLAIFGSDEPEQQELCRLPQDREAVQDWLDADDHFRAWNTKFDLHFLESAGFRLPSPERWHDAMVAAHIINENRSLALKSVASTMYGEQSRAPEQEVKAWLAAERKRRREASKETGEQYLDPNYSHIPDDIMDPYALEDVILTRAVAEQHEKVLRDNPELGAVYRFEMEVMAALYAVERRGVPMDTPGVYRYENELAESLEQIEAECCELAGDPDFNCNSTKQVVEAFGRRGADISFARKTKTGVSMDEESLSAIDDPLADALLRFRGEFKNLGTYVKPLIHDHYDKKLGATKHAYIDADGRIHPNYRQVGARNGRMSAADPNIQNFPRDDLRLRYLVKADPGHKLIACDLDNIELHLFAAFAGDGPMKDAINAGMDAHAQTAEFIGLTERKRATGVEPKRDRGKRFNYSVIYGAGLRSIRRTFRVSQADARRMLDRYHMAYPEVGRLQRDIEYTLQDRGYIQTYKGRRFRIKPRDAYKAPNYLIAGTAAEMLKEAIITLHKAGVPIIAPVHDELLVHVPEKDAPEVAHLMQQAMTDFDWLKEKVPCTAEAKIVDRWSQAKQPDFVPSFAK